MFKKVYFMSVFVVVFIFVAGTQVTTAYAAAIERVSVASDGTQGNNDSDFSSVSADGRYVVFDSIASNLVLGDTNNQNDIFIRDRQTGTTERISVASNGTQGNGSSNYPAISSDGYYVAFQSSAPNLVLGDTNGRDDIFVYDRQNHTTERASVASDGTQGNHTSGVAPSISTDGRFVAFNSQATNLVLGDTNNSTDFFVRDRQTNTTKRVSIAPNGLPWSHSSPANQLSISADGRFVAFCFDYEIFVHDQETGSTEKVSIASDGSSGNGKSYPSGSTQTISSDGRYVVFNSASTNFDTNRVMGSFVRDRVTRTTKYMSVASATSLSISANGRFVVFDSYRADLVLGDTNRKSDIFVLDLQTNIIQRVSVSSDGLQGNGHSSYSSVSSDGHYITFQSDASNLVSGDTNNQGDIFIVENPLFPISVNQPPTLTFPSETGYDDNGLYPDKGVAKKDDLNFKVQYTDEAAPQDVTLHLDQIVGFDSNYFLQIPYITPEAMEHVYRANVPRPNLPNNLLGYEGILGYRPGFDKGESIVFTPGGRTKSAASVEFYVTRISGGFGPEFLTVALEALNTSGAVVAREEKKVDVSDIADYASILETLHVSSNNGDIESVRYSITDASFSLTFDAEAWIKTVSFDEVVTMVRESAANPDYTNGEVYMTTSRFPKGTYSYYFTTADTENIMDRLPDTGALSFTTGYSSVAFLPGHQASRLYRQDPDGPDNKDKLWEPTPPYVQDIGQLRLKDDGRTSEDPQIYTKEDDIIDESSENIKAPWNNTYKKFIQYLDKLVGEDDLIAEWKPFPYDWRLPIEEIADGNVKLEGGATYNMIEEIEKLAKSSDSGKVMLIGHSNGGLLAKVLMDRLVSQGKGDLVSDIVLVASPQIGTPQAIMELLHGGDAPLGEATRELGENMISAYNLIPSQRYSNEVEDWNGQGSSSNFIIFDKSVADVGFGDISNLYGGEVNNYSELRSFILGDLMAVNHRKEPLSWDLNEPNVLDKDLLEYVETVSKPLLDPWDTDLNNDGKTDVNVTQIVGSGIKTLGGIEYRSGHNWIIPGWECNTDPDYLNEVLSCKTKTLEREPLETSDGDGTVVIPSASVMMGEKGVETYFVDLDKYNRDDFWTNRNRNHSSITEVPNLQEIITRVLTGDTESSLPEFILTEKPNNSPKSNMIISTHSPVSLHVYDSAGNHTGKVYDPETQTYYIEEQIPNSSFNQYDEANYIVLDTRDTYRIEVKGDALGTYTLKIEETQGDNKTDELKFESVPVSKGASGTIVGQNVDTMSNLSVDINGDNISDIEIEKSSQGDDMSLEVLKKLVEELDIHKGTREAIVAQIGSAQNAARQDNGKVFNDRLEHIQKFIQQKNEEKGKEVKISKEIADRLILIIEQFKN